MTSTPPPGYDLASRSSLGWTASDREAPQPPLDPLSRGLLTLAAGLSLLLILIVAISWLHGGGSNPLNPIAEAAERTERSPGSRQSFEANYSSPAISRQIVMRGVGVYNGQTGRSQATMTLPPPLRSLRMEAVGDRSSVFLRSSVITAGLPPGKQWLGIEPMLGQSTESALEGSSNPKRQLEMLRAVAGKVETVGRQDVRGVPTTQYRSSFDLHDMAEFFDREGDQQTAQMYEQLASLNPSQIEVEAWVDAKGLVRQSRVVMTLPAGPNRPAISMDMRIDYFDFGITPAIRLPQPSEVFNATPIVRAQLHLLNGSPAPAAGS